MTDKDMCWGAQGGLNMMPKASNAATSKPRPQECVGKNQNCDLYMGSSGIIGNEKGLKHNSCRSTNCCTARNRLETQSCTNKYVRNNH